MKVLYFDDDSVIRTTLFITHIVGLVLAYGNTTHYRPIFVTHLKKIVKKPSSIVATYQRNCTIIANLNVSTREVT